MTYKHLSTTELTTIYAFWKNGEKAYKVSQHLRRSKQTIYHVYHALEDGLSVVDYQERYIKNKAKCGRKRIILPVDETDYINERIKDGWTPDTIIGRSEHQISCNTRTLYRMFKRGYFDVHQLPMKNTAFADWQGISNKHDISTYFAQVGTPNQRGLNENNNGLLRKEGLEKLLDFCD